MKIAINNQNKGAVGEHLVAARLLILGHDASITNFTVNNSKSFDLFCRHEKSGNIVPIQVKTTSSANFHTGITHEPFFDDNGNVDMAKGRQFVEQKIICPWVFVDVSGDAEKPNIRYFVLTRQQVIDFICITEEWYLTWSGRKKTLSHKGIILLSLKWFGDAHVLEPKKALHDALINPFENIDFEDAWDNIWK
jgi:hypothetical protein